MKARQGAHEARSQSSGEAPDYWDRRRPRYLFTGLMRCAVCGGGIVNFNKRYIGCANARNKGTCENHATMRRGDLETAVLDGLQNRLMEPARTKIFCEEYARAMNRLHAERNAQRAADENALTRAERDLARLVQALLEGVPASAVREKMTELEARRDALRRRLSASEDNAIRLHPKMASYYRAQIADLRTALSESGRRTEAAEIVRKLIDRIELSPVARNGRNTLSVSLYGRLAGILPMATKAKTPLDESDAPMKVTKLVAGAGFRRTLTAVRLSRGRSCRQICARITIGGWAHGVPAATCAKKLTRSPSGRASILKKGLALYDLPSFKEDEREARLEPAPERPAASRQQSSRRSGTHELTEFLQLASAGRAPTRACAPSGPPTARAPLSSYSSKGLARRTRR